MHATYYRPGGVYRDSGADAAVQPSKWRSEKKCATSIASSRLAARLHRRFRARFPACVDEYETLLTDNRIWKQRTVDIGIVTPNGRGTRLHRSHAARFGRRLGSAQETPYEVYADLDFDIPVGVNGDCYDRYLVRVEEMRQSARIIKQCIDWLRANPRPSCSTITS